MELSKLGEDGDVGAAVTTSVLHEFYEEYQPLDCLVCNHLVGFQNRESGYMIGTSYQGHENCQERILNQFRARAAAATFEEGDVNVEEIEVEDNEPLTQIEVNVAVAADEEEEAEIEVEVEISGERNEITGKYWNNEDPVVPRPVSVSPPPPTLQGILNELIAAPPPPPPPAAAELEEDLLDQGRKNYPSHILRLLEKSRKKLISPPPPRPPTPPRPRQRHSDSEEWEDGGEVTPNSKHVSPPSTSTSGSGKGKKDKKKKKTKSPPTPEVHPSRSRPTIEKYPDIFKPAEESRPRTNPFFKNIPTTKFHGEGGEPLTLTKVVGLDDATRNLILSSSQPKSSKTTQVVGVAGPSTVPPAPPAPVASSSTSSKCEAKSTPKVEEPVPGPSQEKVDDPPPPKRYMWEDCPVSENLKTGSFVKIRSVWNVETFLIFPEQDEEVNKAGHARVQELVKQGKLTRFTRAPVRNELAVTKNGYRCRVVEVKPVEEDLFMQSWRKDDDKWIIMLVYVDFGETLGPIKYSYLFQYNEEIMEIPVYAIKVHLHGLKKLVKFINPGKKLGDVFNGRLQMEVVDPFILGLKEEFEIIIWIEENKSLNDVVGDILKQVLGAGRGRV